MSRSAARQELYARIDAGLNGTIKGWTFNRQPVESVEGNADKPSLHISQLRESEDTNGSGVARPTLTVLFKVASEKVIMREETRVDPALDKHMENVRDFKNVVECDTAGSRDLLLVDNLAAPLEWTVSDVQTTSQSYATALTLVLKLRPEQKGTRS